MKHIKKYWILLSLSLAAGGAWGTLRIDSWDQKNLFNDRGQEVEVTVKLKAANLPESHYYDNWTMIFDRGSRISLLEARAPDDGDSRATFGDNRLKFKFRKLFNSQEIILKFRYQIDNEDIAKTPYLRRESVDLPNFARGARARLEVHSLEHMTLYSIHPLFQRDGNVFRWRGTLGKEGLRDTFSMTRNRATWRVTTLVKIEDSRGIGNLVVQLPLDYVGGNNEIIEYNVSNGQVDYPDGNFLEKRDDAIVAKFKNFASTRSFVRIDATLVNDYSNFNWVNDFDFASTTKIEEKYIEPLSSLVNGIDSAGDRGLPIHVKIAKWVHQNITYDESFVGRRMTSMDILKIKRGVCEHYAILYQDMVRSVNIPSKTIVGLSYNFEKKKFENHAWVMVYHNGQWIPIDPTWGIYSGKLPISHIFMYNDLRNAVSYSRLGSLDSLSSSLEHQVEFIR
ncbi:MAG: transglutaminase-like domain-containing protein [Rickettsiales bacterium]|nr:transglutaminase-like domain-containing protein [Rickettsiales bacterium]